MNTRIHEATLSRNHHQARGRDEREEAEKHHDRPARMTATSTTKERQRRW